MECTIICHRFKDSNTYGLYYQNGLIFMFRKAIRLFLFKNIYNRKITNLPIVNMWQHNTVTSLSNINFLDSWINIASKSYLFICGTITASQCTCWAIVYCIHTWLSWHAICIKLIIRMLLLGNQPPQLRVHVH